MPTFLFELGFGWGVKLFNLFGISLLVILGFIVFCLVSISKLATDFAKAEVRDNLQTARTSFARYLSLREMLLRVVRLWMRWASRNFRITYDGSRKPIVLT